MSAAEEWRLGEGQSPVRLYAHVGEGAHVIAKVYLTDPVTRKRTPEMLARAKMIEAAPSLLAALKCAFVFLDPDTSESRRGDSYEAFKMVRDAIKGAGVKLPVDDGIDLDETEIELIEAGTGDFDGERSTGKRATDLYQWQVVLTPAADEELIARQMDGLDVTFTLSPDPWAYSTFSGSREDLETLRRKIAGVEV